MSEIIKKEENKVINFEDADKYFIEKIGVPSHELSVIKKQIAPGISNAELNYCLNVAKEYELNPILKQIWFIKRGGYVGMGDNKKWVEKYEPMVGRDGCRVIARRKGLKVPVKTWTEIKKVPKLTNEANGTFEMVEDLVAFASLTMKNPDTGENVEVVKDAYFHVYAQRTKKGEITKFWKDNPTGQLMKVAEVNLLKAVYGIDIENVEGGFVNTYEENVVQTQNGEETIEEGDFE